MWEFLIKKNEDPEEFLKNSRTRSGTERPNRFWVDDFESERNDDRIDALRMSVIGEHPLRVIPP